ncbi:MAG: hypothetical protein KGP28_09190 [Bdellovibrionales bacterium]|nr:hypothetical protein [Bdellovibrionales bacterium]
MSSEANALTFLSLYLEQFLPGKNLDLLKLKLIKRARKNRTRGPGLSEVALIRGIVEVLRKRRKTILAHLDPQEVGNPALVELLKISPEDALLLCSGSLCPIPLKLISLALQAPEPSLLFRRTQLEAQFKELQLDLNDLVSTESTTQKRTVRTPVKRKGLISSYQALPMAARFLLETICVLSLLLGLLWVIPEVRNRYESSIQSRINEYLIESALIDSPAPEGTSKEPKAPILSEQMNSQEEPVTKSSSDAPSQKRQPKVIPGETWRFSFTGSATTEIEEAILEAIDSMGIEGQKPLNVPGGIQFDFMLESARLLDLKNQLENRITSIQKKAAAAQTTTVAYANMSWYKRLMQGNRKIPPNHVQVIIWISTL